MKIALSWLKKWVDHKLSAEQAASVLTSLGIEVEHIESYAPPIQEVVVAEIMQVEPHPNAGKLKIAKVFDGERHWQVVCGAANCREGIKVALARLGACLPGGFEIKKAKLRGIESFGMLCSLDELGYSGTYEEIHELVKESVCGTNAFDWINDPVLCLSLTPNLGHCLSIEGIARELAAKMDLPLKNPYDATHLDFDPSYKLEPAHLAAPQVQQYSYMLIEGVEVQPSPPWLAYKLQQAGYRSVNNLVDAGNWVMLELGRPVHIFDADTLQGSLKVGLAHGGEKIVRIDGVEQLLAKDTLAVFDAQGPVAIAGVMGSSKHEVSCATSRIVLEVAVFEPQAVRRSARQSQCHSESSRRYERGVDLAKTPMVFEAYIKLLQDLEQKPRYSGIQYSCQQALPRKSVLIRSQDVSRLLGLHMGLPEIAVWLAKLGIDSQVLSEQNALECLIPSWRHDLAISADLVEELMRLVGTENLAKGSCTFSLTADTHQPLYLLTHKLRHSLAGFGLQEVVTVDLVSEQKLQDYGIQSQYPLKLINPSSIEADLLRPSLLVSFIEVVKHNIDQQNFDLAIFEAGQVYQSYDKELERSVVGILLSGQSASAGWMSEARVWDFYDIKGIAESLLASLRINCKIEKGEHPYLHPGQQANLLSQRGELLGVCGKVHPTLLARCGIDQPTFYAELSLKELLHAQACACQYQNLPSFPGASRDWTLTLDESLSYEKVLGGVPTVDNLVEVKLVSIWRSLEKLGADRKNMTLRFFYRSHHKTLTQQEIEAAHSFVKEHVIKNLNIKPAV